MLLSLISLYCGQSILNASTHIYLWHSLVFDASIIGGCAVVAPSVVSQSVGPHSASPQSVVCQSVVPQRVLGYRVRQIQNR